MNEWTLQKALTQRWAAEGVAIPPFEHLDLIAWEVMFPSWDINYKRQRWNEPSIDFVFLAPSGALVLLELKYIVPDRRSFLSAFCQVSHRAWRFYTSYTRDRLWRAHRQCIEGAGDRSIRFRGLPELAAAPNKLRLSNVHRAIGAVSLPRRSEALLHQLNGITSLRMLIGLADQYRHSTEFTRLQEIIPSDYEDLSSSPVHVLTIPTKIA